MSVCLRAPLKTELYREKKTQIFDFEIILIATFKLSERLPVLVGSYIPDVLFVIM